VRSGRLPALVVLAGLIVGGLVLDANDDPEAPATSLAPSVAAGVAMPAANPPGALSSTWYCAGGTSAEDGVADHTVIIQNPLDEDADVTLTVIGGAILPPPPEGLDDADAPPAEDGAATTVPDPAEETTTTTQAPALPQVEPVVEDRTIPASSREDIRLGDLIDAPIAGAIVEVDGGGVAVEHSVDGEYGRSTTPCSSTVSDSWSFPWGVTSLGTPDGDAANRELLVFLNPFADDATLDVEFATDEGSRMPTRFDSFVVPGRTIRAAWVDQSTRRNQISAQVTVRSGRIVADRIQILTGEADEDPRRGMSLSGGIPVPSEVWVFPAGQTTANIGEQIVVYNPTDESAEVQVEVRVSDPEENGFPEPFSLTVGPKRFSVVSLGDERRVPRRVGHTVIVRAVNGVPVTAERVQWATPPSDNLGVSSNVGSPLSAPIWYFPGGGPTDEVDQWMTLVNLSNDEAVTASISGFGGGRLVPYADLQEIDVPPAGRVEIRLGDHANRPRLPLVVEASGPVVTERGLYQVDGFGLSNSVGIPLAQDIVVPAPLVAG
jgi:hypothetical protein